jgi:hypothetical protein
MGANAKTLLDQGDILVKLTKKITQKAVIVERQYQMRRCGLGRDFPVRVARLI